MAEEDNRDHDSELLNAVLGIDDYEAMVEAIKDAEEERNDTSANDPDTQPLPGSTESKSPPSEA